MMEHIQRGVIGYVITAYCIFLAACLGSLNSFTVVASLCAGSISFVILKRSFSGERLVLHDGEAKHGILVSLLLFLPLAHVFLIPPYVRDDVIYHLFTIKRMVRTGGLVIDPYNINTNFPMTFEMPLTIVHMLHGLISPFVINYAFLFLLCVYYYFTARRLFNVNYKIALLCAAAIASTPVVYDLVHSCYVEIFLSLLILIAVSNYALFIGDRKNVRHWYLTMLFIGFACAVKYLGLFFAAYFIIVEFFSATRRKPYYQGIAICFAACFPWYLKNWMLYGNPTYPLLNFFFQSDSISIKRSIIFSSLLANYHMGREWFDYLLLPFRVLAGVDGPVKAGELGFGGKLSLFFAAGFFIFRHRWGRYKALTGLIVSYTLFWAVSSQQVRFLLPVLIPATLLGILWIYSHWSSYRRVTALILILAISQNVYNIALSMKRDRIDSLVSRKISKEDFLAYHMPISYSLAGELNRTLDHEQSRLLAVGNFGRNYYFEMDVLTNTYFESEILAGAFRKGEISPEILERFIEENHITHLLFNRGYFREFHSDDDTVDVEGALEYLQQKNAIITRGSVVVYKL